MIGFNWLGMRSLMEVLALASLALEGTLLSKSIRLEGPSASNGPSLWILGEANPARSHQIFVCLPDQTILWVLKTFPPL